MILDELQPFAISLLIGLAAGIERERSSQEGEGTMGVRTFSLISLAGAVAAVANAPALTLSLGFIVLTLAAVGYWRGTSTGLVSGEAHVKADIGLTTEFAAALVFALGYLSGSNPLVAGILGIVLVTVLYSRNRLHDFSRKVLRPTEIRAGLTLAFFAFVIIPFIPDQTVDPWELINPRRLAQIMAMIAGLEFGGYAVERFAGPRIGLLATGFFGGLASSTAVFLNLAKMAKSRPEVRPGLLGAGLMATTSTVMLFVAITLVTAPQLGYSVGLPATVCLLVSGLLGFATSRNGKYFADKPDADRNPMDLRGAARLGFFVFGLLALSAIVKRTLGSDALMAVSFFGGLFELHGVTYANAALYVSGALTSSEASVTLLLALFASFFSKIVICWTLSFGRFALIMTGYLLIVVSSGLLTCLLMNAAK